MGLAGIFRITMTTLVAGAIIGLVTVWSLAAPQNDPVGAALGLLEEKALALASWYDGDPVAARPDWQAMSHRVPGADAERGRQLIADNGCGACHVIPGVPGARGTVGPPLNALADRSYIAGILSNTPGELTRWLMNPPYFAQDTVMPDLNLSERQAKDMAAYLYLLGEDG